MADVKISNLPAAATPLDGTEVLPIVKAGVTDQVSVANLTAGRAVSASGVTVTGLTASQAVLTDASKALVSVATTGSGSVVRATSPSLTTPNLGTPSAATLTNATGLPLSTGVTGTLPVANGGTGATTSTGSGAVVLASSPTLITPNLGTPSAATLTNATGLPLSTGVTGSLPVVNGGTGNSSWTSNGLVYASATTTLANSANFTFDGSVLSFDTGGKVLLGATASSLAAGLQTFGSTNTANVNFKRYSNDAIGPTIAIFKTRDTTTSGFASVQANDQIGSIAFVGSQGTSAATLAVMDAYVDPTGSVSATSLPGMLTWATVPDGSLGVGSERMRLQQNGNLGVGTTSPTARLTVKGAGTTSATTGLAVQDSSNNNLFVVRNDGNVGIGTASPGALLDVGGGGLRVASTGAMTSENLADAVGYKGTPLNEQSAAYTLVIGDMGKSIVHPASDNNARTFTIPANGTVAFPVGTTITFINMINTVTIAITTDTMYLAGSGSTGSRTLAAYGMATAVKMTSTTWIISGNGLT